MTEGDVHTFPINDAIAHETNGQPCPCGPEVKPVLGRAWPDEPFRQVGRQVIHHSLDGRENCGCGQ